ncbi:MAG: sugar ABC transporter permease [Caldilineaceae bacterium]
MYRNKYRVIIPFLIPSILLYVTFVLYPYGRSMYISLTQWRGLARAPVFIGLENFQHMWGDSNFWNALGNNAFYIVVLPIFTLSLAIFFAFIFSQGVPLSKFYRVTYFFPQVMSVVAIGVLWSFVYHPTIGILTSILQMVGIEAPPVWLGNPDTVLGAVAGVTIWHEVGFYMILFLAAMESIPMTYYEAAMLDGASRWHLFWNITLPMIRDTLQTGVIFLMINATNMFAITQTMTEGGPSRSSEVLSTYLYNEAFINSNFGYGTAIAVALFFLTLVISVVLSRLLSRETLEY